jgi:hypothetical protein
MTRYADMTKQEQTEERERLERNAIRKSWARLAIKLIACIVLGWAIYTCTHAHLP